MLYQKYLSPHPLFQENHFLTALQVKLKRSANFKRRRDSSLTSAPYSLDPTEFTMYTDQEWRVDTSITSPHVQIESRNGSCTSSFLEDQVGNSITYPTSSHPKIGQSLLPPSALPELPLVLNGPTGPTDIKGPQGIEPDITKRTQRASRWRRKIKSAISQK